ncbi:hypothetical protein [Pseudomonas pseudonitroreducens]|uniref:hypothetical protein n=1 Tax=Pseudomonas pseudonitroreducens TaxID=2892326 RepID=UPI001F192179|nr:hypothetical protein [Pseudomonas pseudonitroreducens]
MKQTILSRIVFVIFISTPIPPISCLARTPALGNRPGEIRITSQTGLVEIRQDECNYSAHINSNQTIIHNTPDIIIHESTPAIIPKLTPYLWQPETYSGYDWSFKNPGRKNLRWFGLICESAENLPFLKEDKLATGLGNNEIIESNKRKCPADLVNGKFTLTQELDSDKKYTIERITNSNWTGFLVLHRSKSKNKYDQMRFCLLHDDIVLIGSTENMQPAPMLDEKFRTMVIEFINSIKFQ